MNAGSITFSDEASESFANFVQYIEGYVVEVVPDVAVVSVSDVPSTDTFDAIVVGSASDTTGDYFGVRVRLYDDVKGVPVGEPFDVVVRELRVY